MDIVVMSRGVRESCLGMVLQLKVHAPDYRPLGWSDVHAAFNAHYPGRWAVQVFPPADQLVDGKPVYHLFVLDHEPEGLNIRCG